MFPSSIHKWRFWREDHRRESVHTLWEPLAPFFAEHGLILFKPVPDPDSDDFQPDLPDPTAIRAPDGYHHWSPPLIFKTCAIADKSFSPLA